jgi:hypothetical protein
MRPWLILVLCVCLAIPASAQTRRRSKGKSTPKRAAPAEKAKIAEGRYQMNTSVSGVNFEEPWTLWKTKLGYELAEQWLVPARGDNPPQAIDVNVQMVGQLRPIQVHIGDAASGLTCKIALGSFNCESQGKATQLAVDGPYDFFSPSPWMLGNIVRRAVKNRDQKSSITLVRIDGASYSGVKMTSFAATVQYVGEDQVEVDGQKHAASIYEMKAEGFIPGMLVWVSDDGIVLAVQDSSQPDQRLDLTNLQRYGKM